MRRTSFVAAASLAGALVVSTAACTIVSGVEGMELRQAGPSAATPAPAGDGADGGTPDGAASATGPGGGSASPQTGRAVCGSEGSWTDCDPTPSLATCAQRCTARGLTCVEDCCAYDSVGDYRAKAGLIYAVLPELECALTSVSGSGKGGLCGDPTLLAAGGAAQVRCCCK